MVQGTLYRVPHMSDLALFVVTFTRGWLLASGPGNYSFTRYICILQTG